MKTLTTGLLVLSLVAAAGMPAAAWTLTPCSADTPEAASRAAYARALRDATPGSGLYTPNPFPRTDAQRFENFVAFHTEAFGDMTADELGREERRLLGALAEDRVDYEVLEVENWTPLRCGPRKARRTWYVLRLYDTASGEEIARATVDDTGHVGRLRHKPEGRALTPILDLDTAARALSGHASPKARDAQYVSTWGTLKCDELTPCVAMRHDNAIYLLDGRTGDLHRIAGVAKGLSFREDLSIDNRGRTLREAAQAGRRLVSLGGDLFVRAEPLGRLPGLAGQ